MIVCNDVMAYMFGFFFGRTPLIKLSPKKTWEGFIGGGFSTVLFGLIVSIPPLFPFIISTPVSCDEFQSFWILNFRFPIICVNSHSLSAQLSIRMRTMWAQLDWTVSLPICSRSTSTSCPTFWDWVIRLVSSPSPSTSTRFSSIPFPCHSLAASLDRLADSLHPDSNEHSKSR